MTAWLIVGLCVLAVLLLLQLRVRVLTEYRESGVHLRLGLGALRFTVYPLRTKREKVKREKKPAKPPKQKKKKTQADKTDALGAIFEGGMLLESVREILSFSIESLGEFTHKLRIDELYLRLDWGLEDPADSAIYYGYAHAALGVVIALLEANFTVKRRHTEIRLDYTLEKPKLYLRASCSLRVRQIFSMLLHMGLRGLRLYQKMKAQAKANVQNQSDEKTSV